MVQQPVAKLAAKITEKPVRFVYNIKNVRQQIMNMIYKADASAVLVLIDGKYFLCVPDGQLGYKRMEVTDHPLIDML